MTLPFKAINGMVWDADGRLVACCNDNSIELCSILNAHFSEKRAEPDPGGICDKCLSIHGSAFIGQKCISSKDCGGTVQDIHTPQPNREETDAIAAMYFDSRRQLKVQYYAGGKWTDFQPCDDNVLSFDYALPWRIKPQRRRVVVEIYRSLDGSIFSRVEDGNNVKFGPDVKLLGTLEGEVES